MIQRPVSPVIVVLIAITGWLNLSAQAAGQRPVRITEVYLSPPGSFVGSQKVELTNLGAQAVDIGGWCLRANELTRPFPLGTILEPSGVLTIHIGSWGHNNNENYYTGDDFPSLRRFWDSIELHRAGTNFEEPDLLEDFVMWGGAFHATADLAVDAGVWEVGTFLPAVSETGGAYQLCDRESFGASAWEVGNAGVGILNECLLVTTPVETISWGKVKARFLN